MNRIYSNAYPRGKEKIGKIKEQTNNLCSSLFEIEKFLCDAQRLYNIMRLRRILK